MHFSSLKNKPIKDWLMDNAIFLDAYYAADRDKNLKAEIKQLEIKYIRQYLVDQVGEDEADRIMTERGY